MKVSSLLVVLIHSSVVWAISAAGSTAQSDMQLAKESQGLFTISFPVAWRVLEVPRDRIAEALHVPAGTPTDMFEALMIAKAPDEDPGCFVMLSAFKLQRRVTALDLWLTGGNQILKGFAEHKTLDEGLGHAGDREVYYNKFTWKSDAATGALNYSLMEILIADMTGYMFLGTVPNDTQSIEKHVPLFESIMATLAPTPGAK